MAGFRRGAPTGVIFLTMKQAAVSSADQGGGKRRGSGLSIITLSVPRAAASRAR